MTICTSPLLLALALMVLILFTTVLTSMLPVKGTVLLPCTSFAFETVTFPMGMLAILVLKIKSPKLIVIVDGLGSVRLPTMFVPSASGVERICSESSANPSSWFKPATVMVLSIEIGLLIAPRCKVVLPRKLISLVTSLLDIHQNEALPEG